MSISNSPIIRNSVGTLQSPGSNAAKTASSNMQFEEKFVHVYRGIFQGNSPIHSKRDAGIQAHAVVTRFWDELLLLKVNEGFLMQCFSSFNEVQLQTNLKLVMNELFGACSMYLDDGNFIRIAHALETLVILFQEIFKKQFAEKGSTIITLIAGSVENADTFFSKLISRIACLLKRDDVPIPVKLLCLRLYFTMLTTTDNVNTNIIASYFFQTNVLGALVAALTVKLADDRRCLELDATLVLILLLLWRESENLYAGCLSLPDVPIFPFLEASHSLLSFEMKLHDESQSKTSSENWSLADSVVGLFGNLFGLAFEVSKYNGIDKNVKPYTSTSFEGLTMQEEIWLHTVTGAVMTYFLVYLSPLLKSCQLWQPSSNECFQSSASVAHQSTSGLFHHVIREFLLFCGSCFHQLCQEQQAPVLLQAKNCLNTLRCLLEAPECFNYLALCDAKYFQLHEAPHVMSGIAYTIPFKSKLCVIVDHVADISNTKADLLDPDLLSRALLLIPLAFNTLKSRGWKLAADSIKWWQLWDGLMHLCEWIGRESVFQRSGASELAVLLLDIIEGCLGNIQEICSVPEENEILHAMVMSYAHSIDGLMQRASSIGGSSHLSNIASVKLHYDIQLKTMGIRGCPSHQQALQAVKKKGASNLKVKPKHVGPTHSYAEGRAELRLLINTARFLVAARRKLRSLDFEARLA